MKNKIKNRNIIKNLTTYLIILIIPCIIGIFAYDIVVNALIEDTYKIQEITLENLIKEVDGEIGSIYDIFINISSKKDVIDFSKRYTYSDVETIEDSIKIKNNFVYTESNNISEIIVFFKNSNLAISTNLISDIKDFYNINYYNNYNNYDEFYESIFSQDTIVQNSSEQKYKYGGVTNSVLAFTKSINASGNTVGMVLLNTKKIKENFNDAKYEGGNIIIIDNNNNNILDLYDNEYHINISDLQLNNNSGSFVKKFNGEKMIITYNKSKLNLWNYISIQPYNKVVGKVNKIKIMIIWYVIIYLAIGVILSLYWTNKNQIKFGNILNVIIDNVPQLENINKKDFSNKDIEKIKIYMENFKNNSKLIEENSIKQKSIINNLLLNKLLNGNFNTSNEIEKHISVLGNDKFSKANNFIVCVIKGKYFIEENNKITLKELLKNLNNDAFEFCDNEGDSIAIILYGENKKNKENIINLSNTIIKFYSEYEEEKFIIGIGSDYNSKLDIYKSYQEAIVAMDTKASKEMMINGVYVYSIDKNNNKLFYPIEIETRLINCTKLGLIDEVKEIIEQIMDENFYNTTIAPIIVKGLLFELYGTLVKIINQVNNSNLDKEIDKEIEELYEVIQKGLPSMAIIKINDMYCKICSNIIKNKKNINEVLQGNLIDYIKYEFANPNLTISDVANEFTISSGYASKIVKECTGETFFSYLENIRMENAQILIDTTDLPIYVIAEKSGYQLSATFCRAYKRRYNISPNKSRENKKQVSV